MKPSNFQKIEDDCHFVLHRECDIGTADKHTKKWQNQQ